jgi:predicted metal-dependent RNase
MGTASRPPREVFVTHGEPDSSHELARSIRKSFDCRTHVPKLDESFELDELLVSEN